MHIAIVVNSFPVISETFIFNKISGLLAAGLDMTVMVQSTRSDKSMFAERMSHLPVTLVQPSLLARGKFLFPFELMLAILRNPYQALNLWIKARKAHTKVRQAIKAWVLALPLELGRYDLVHFEYSGLAVSYLDALPLLSGRLFISCRGSAERIVPLVNPMRGEQLRKVFGYVQRVHCVSVDMQRTVEKFGLRPEQGFVNHPAIDVAKFQRSTIYPQKTVGPYHLVSVGRLHWTKGLEFGLLAMRKLVDDGLDVTYDIIGRGDEEEKLRYAIANLDLGQRVRLMGHQSAEVVRESLEMCDVCLLPSLSEGLSNVALEAMSMEVPVVSTTVGGMDEAISDGQDGFLVSPWQPNLLAEKIRILLEDSSLRYRMGQAARRKIEQKFCLENQIKIFVDEYRNSYKETMCD